MIVRAYRLLLFATMLTTTAWGCARSSGETAPSPTPTLPSVSSEETSPAPPGNSADLKAAATAANGFGLRLLQTVAKEKPGANVFLSPTSLDQALGLAFAGSEKQTRTQMASVLGLPEEGDAAGQQHAALAAALAKTDPKVTLQIANAIWSDDEFPFRDTFTQQAAANYSARALSLDLSAPGSADTINRWVSDATKGKIPKLVTPDIIRDSSAVLTNAVYFKGTWQSPFERSATRSHPFTPETGKAFSVPLMRQTGFYEYAAGDTFEMVRLPYGKGRWGMIAVLPRLLPESTKVVSLASVVGSMTEATFAAMVSKLQGERITLGVPRFKLTYSGGMREPLTALGMGRAFERDAEFEPMFQRGTHKIDQVIHKTVLEVNEEGTEAAAATGIIMAPTSAVIGQPRSVVLDRPFACFIVDRETGAIVFAGAVYRPETL